MTGVKNFTTQISVDKTVGEMQAMLGRAGASRIAVDYDQGEPVGLAFLLPTPHGERSFDLPVDIGAMHRLMVKQSAAGQLSSLPKAKRTSLEQAARVAWRIMRDWLDAQLALVETQMVSLDQVMLPYLVTAPGVTLYGAYIEREQVLALTQGVVNG